MSVRDWYYAVYVYDGKVYVGEIDHYNLPRNLYIIQETYHPGSEEDLDPFWVTVFRDIAIGMSNAGIPLGKILTTGVAHN